MKILLDMNMSPMWVTYLQSLDIVADVQHWASIGAVDAQDADILAFAVKNEWIIFTRDLDFGKLLAFSNDNKPSVIQLRLPDARPEVCGSHVLRTLCAVEHNLRGGAIVTIHEKMAKVRILPMQQ